MAASSPPDLCGTAQTGGYGAITLSTSFVTVFIIVALSILAVGLAAVLHKKRAGSRPDLGCLSERWLVEYRADRSRLSR